MMYRLAYRNFGDHESLVTNHSVDVSGHSGLRWYEVRSPGGTPTVFQQGTFSARHEPPLDGLDRPGPVRQHARRATACREP